MEQDGAWDDGAQIGRSGLERIMDYLRGRGRTWSARYQVVTGADVDTHTYDKEVAWLRGQGLVEYRYLQSRDLPSTGRRGRRPSGWMVRLATDASRAADARAADAADVAARRWVGRPPAPWRLAPTVLGSAPDRRRMLGSPMVLAAACLSLAARIVHLVRPHTGPHLCQAGLCPAVWLQRLNPQDRAALRPLLTGLTGRSTAWHGEDPQHMWHLLCTLGAELRLDPTESVSDAYSYTLTVLETVQDTVPQTPEDCDGDTRL